MNLMPSILPRGGYEWLAQLRIASQKQNMGARKEYARDSLRFYRSNLTVDGPVGYISSRKQRVPESSRADPKAV